MNQKELQRLARQYLIFGDGLSESNLVRKIQRAEGEVDCFATGRTTCDNTTCRWRQDCLVDPASDMQTTPESLPEKKRESDE